MNTCWFLKLIKSEVFVQETPIGTKDLPIPEPYKFLEKCSLLSNFIWHSSISFNETANNFDPANPRFEIIETTTESFIPVYGGVMLLEREEDYHSEIYNKIECEFLLETISLAEKLNNQLTQLYREIAGYLQRMIKKYAELPSYAMWGYSKIFVHASEDIYPIISPLIISNHLLGQKLKTHTTYKRLVIPVKTTALSETLKSLDSTFSYMAAPHVHAVCESYLNLIEDDLDKLRSLIQCIGEVAEPASYRPDDFPDFSSVIEFGSREELQKRRYRLLDWETLSAEVIYFYQDEESKKNELKKVVEKYQGLIADLTKNQNLLPLPSETKKIHEKFISLKYEQLLQESQIEFKYFCRRVKYEREIIFQHYIVIVSGVENQNKWTRENKRIDSHCKKCFGCKKAWLKSDEKWKKLVPVDLLEQVQVEIENEEIPDADTALCMMPMDVGSQIKKAGFVDNEISLAVNMKCKGSSSMIKNSSLHLMSNNGEKM